MASINRLRWCLNALDGHLRRAMACAQIWNVAVRLYTSLVCPREWVSLCIMWACACVCLRYKTVKKCSMSGLGWTAAAKGNETWWFSRRSSIMMLIHKWLMFPKMDAKASIATLHVYNMTMGNSFLWLCTYSVWIHTSASLTIILIPIPVLPAHYVFRLFHEILANIRFCLLVCLFISIDFFELIGPIQQTHTHTRLSHEILTFSFMCSI